MAGAHHDDISFFFEPFSHDITRDQTLTRGEDNIAPNRSLPKIKSKTAFHFPLAVGTLQAKQLKKGWGYLDSKNSSTLSIRSAFLPEVGWLFVVKNSFSIATVSCFFLVCYISSTFCQF